MFSKIILSILVFFIFSFNLSWAESPKETSPVEITVTGRGLTMDEALQDAFRNAIEGITGVYVINFTEVENFQLINDEIVTHSTGFIKKYEVLSERKADTLIILSVRCQVDGSPLKELIRKKNLQTWDNAIADLALVQQIQNGLPPI